VEEIEEEEKFEFEGLLEKEKEELEQRLREDKQMDNRHWKAIEDELERIERLKRQARVIEAERRRLMAMKQKRREIERRLALIGICPAGFVWHREGSGFRCGGGSHVISFGQFGLCR
jgi:hypothetical protein